LFVVQLCRQPIFFFKVVSLAFFLENLIFEKLETDQVFVTRCLTKKSRKKGKINIDILLIVVLKGKNQFSVEKLSKFCYGT